MLQYVTDEGTELLGSHGIESAVEVDVVEDGSDRRVDGKRARPLHRDFVRRDIGLGERVADAQGRSGQAESAVGKFSIRVTPPGAGVFRARYVNDKINADGVLNEACWNLTEPISRRVAERFEILSAQKLGLAEVLAEGLPRVREMVGGEAAAAERLAGRGISAAVVNARFVKPLDDELIQWNALCHRDLSNAVGRYGDSALGDQRMKLGHALLEAQLVGGLVGVEQRAHLAQQRRVVAAGLTHHVVAGVGLGVVGPRQDLLDALEGRARHPSRTLSISRFTSISMFPRLWGVSGLEYPALLDELVRLALERHRRRTSLRSR